MTDLTPKQKLLMIWKHDNYMDATTKQPISASKFHARIAIDCDVSPKAVSQWLIDETRADFRTPNRWSQRIIDTKFRKLKLDRGDK